MPLQTDILFLLTGGGGNSDPLLSLGGVVSVTQVSGSIHGLFDFVSPEEATAGDAEYRAISVKNNGADTLYGAVLYVSTETSSVDTIIALAYDATGTQTVANENTAPSSPALSFSTPYSKATGITLGDMATGTYKRVWLRRTVTAGAAKTPSDAGQLTVVGGTAT